MTERTSDRGTRRASTRPHNANAMYRDLMKPLHWKEPQRIWFDAKVDVFDGSVPVDWINRIFAVMALAPHHTFMVATNFPETMRRYLTHPKTQVDVGLTVMQMVFDDFALNPNSTLGKGVMLKASDINPGGLAKWPLPNVWLGVHVKDQADADARIPALLHTPAALRFVSCEPLLGPVNLDLGWNNDLARWDSRGRELPLRRIDWVIAGGETGRDARPMHPDWVRSLRDQCATADVPFFFTQWGAFVPAAVEDDPNFFGGRAFDDPVGGGRGSPTIRFRGSSGTLRGGEHRLMEPGERTHALVMLERNTVAVRLGRGKTERLLDGFAHDAIPTGVPA